MPPGTGFFSVFLPWGSHFGPWLLCGIQGKHTMYFLSVFRCWPEQVSPGEGSGLGTGQEAPGGCVCPRVWRGWFLHTGEASSHGLLRTFAGLRQKGGVQRAPESFGTFTFWEMAGRAALYPLCTAFPFWALHATPCQLAVGPDKMHGSPSQETGMGRSPSSLLAVSSVKCGLIIFSHPCQFPQATSVFPSLFIATSPQPHATDLLE